MMAEPLSISSSVIVLGAFAFQSSVTLYTAIRSLQHQNSNIHLLKDELSDLKEVLEGLLEIVARRPEIRFDGLENVLLRCGKACEDYARIIAKYTQHSAEGSQPSLRDWLRQQYLQADIDDFRTMLGLYKSTINIALADANLRIASVTPRVIEDYKDMIKDTAARLQDHLQSLDQKVEALTSKHAENLPQGSVEWEALLEEKESAQQGLQICSQASSQIEHNHNPEWPQAQEGMGPGREASEMSAMKEHDEWQQHIWPLGEPRQQSQRTIDSRRKELQTERTANDEYSKQFPNHQVGEDYDELASVRSVESLGSTATGSSATLVDEVLAAANEFTSHLLQDQTLIPLFSAAFDLIPADRVERNIRRLLKLYAIDLQQEARGDIEKEAVQLILTRGRYIAYCVRQCYDKSTLDKTGMFKQLFDLSPDKRALLEDYLRGRTRQPLKTSLSDDNIDDHASDSSISSGEEADGSRLNDLDEVKAFMFESVAFYRFKQMLKDFIRPSRAPKQQNSTRTKSPGLFSFHTWGRFKLKTSEVTHGLQMLWRPLVPPGHKRITWICGCGDYRYADVREYTPNGASTLQENLRKSVATNAYGTDGANSNNPQPPTQAPPPGNLTAKATSHSVPTPSNVHATGQVTANNAIDPSAAGSGNAQRSDQMFLLLCLTFGGASYLEQLVVRDLGNDQYLFEKIRERYHDLHRKAQWYQKLSMTRWLLSKNISWLSKVFTATDLTTANSVEFVRFQLVPIAMDIRPWNFHSPSLPPEVEVRVKKTYHYHPCPLDVDPTCLNGYLLHCLWNHGPHLDRFWLDFFPKKLKETLQYVSSKPETNTAAWGIRVVEGVNWVSVICLALILFTISAIQGIIYSAATHDVGGGFAISAFLGTLPALGIALLHLTPMG